ncbi:hypothetical protein BDF21DRAFT_495411 [Thamnidium elegans]|nr:hypothetical protein BDF21DRAFT_495411 [Thamnidium elegans]
MADKNRKSTQFIPGWPTSHAPKNTTESVKTSSIHEESLDLVPTNELQQGQLYIIKIKLIAIALFQGWDDEMCCFSILRTDLLEDLRWSEARYLPENFDAYLAFDYAGNPPIHLWTKHLRAVIPINWFNIFEEARHMQRQWNVSYWDAPAIESAKPFYSLTDSPVPEEVEEEGAERSNDQVTELDDEEDVIQEGTVIGTEMTLKEIKYYSPQMSRVLPSEPPTSSIVPTDNTTTPAMRLQKQYNNKNVVTQQPNNDLNKIEQQQQQQQQQQQINEDTVDSVSTVINTNNRPEVKQRRSFTSFFLKKKKSKKSINSNDDVSNKREMKRKSAPPTPSINPNQKLKQEIIKEQTTPELITSSNSSTKNRASSSSSSPTVIKTPKNGEVDKLELFDIDSYFDMQATFAFLNNSKQDTLTLLDNKKESIST